MSHKRAFENSASQEDAKADQSSHPKKLKQGNQSDREQPIGQSVLATENGNSHMVFSSMTCPWELTPWTPDDIVDMQAVSLPTISNPAIELAAFSHMGVVPNAGLSYERLEWIGDAYLYLISTLLISSTFTSHLPGKCSQVRETLVKNETLAKYSRHYGFGPRIRMPKELKTEFRGVHKSSSSKMVKVLGDVFEAYVGAIVISDPQHGTNRASKWLKQLWSSSIAEQIRDEAKRKQKTSNIANMNMNMNAKDRLSQAIGCKGVRIVYRDVGTATPDHEGHLVFTIACLLESGLGESGLQLGTGQARSKIDAGLKAAQVALDNETMMSTLKAKKRSQQQTEQAQAIDRERPE